MRRRLLNFTLELPEGWDEITAELPGDAAPTVARARGVGALQFAQVEFEEGPPKPLEATDLLDMVRGVARRADRFIAFDEQTLTDGERCVGAVSLALDENFVRLWGVSDGRGVVVATYTCAWRRRRPTELDECARVIETIRILEPTLAVTA